MITLNNAGIQQFVLDLQRGVTYFRFENFDEDTNQNIGNLIINICRAVNIYSVKIGEYEEGAKDVGLTPLNRLIFLLLNYFWHASTIESLNDPTMATIISENKDVIAYKEEIEVVYQKDKNSDFITDRIYHRMDTVINIVTNFFNKAHFPVVDELHYFFDQYNQSITNPFQPDAIKNFTQFGASLMLEKSEQRIKGFSFTPTKKTIIVKNLCTGIMVNVVDDDLDSININLPSEALSFSSNVIFEFNNENNFVLSRHYNHSGYLFDLFERCQVSSQNTAAFLAMMLIKYRDKEQVFVGFDSSTVNNKINEVISGLKQKYGEDFEQYEKLIKSVLEHANGKSTTICPYLVGPAIGLIFWGGLIVVATVVGSPVAGAAVFGAGFIGGAAGAGTAVAVNKYQERRDNSHKTEITALDVNNLTHYGTFAGSSSPINGSNNIIILNNNDNNRFDR